MGLGKVTSSPDCLDFPPEGERVGEIDLRPRDAVNETDIWGKKYGLPPAATVISPSLVNVTDSDTAEDLWDGVWGGIYAS